MPAPSHIIRLGSSVVPGAGRGIFATAALTAGEIVESCPVIPLSPSDRSRLRKTELVNYYFLWGEKRDGAAVCLGFGSLYNHSYEPNVRFEKHINEARMDFYALRDIAAGEELTINYNGTPSDTTTLWIPSIPPANQGGVPARRGGFLARVLGKFRIA